MTSGTLAPDDRAVHDSVAHFYRDLVFPSRSAHAAYLELLPREPGLRLADFGCGQSIFYEALRDYAPQPVFFDIALEALRTLDYGLRVQGDLFAVPFRADAFDRIYCIGVLHHLPRPGEVLSQIARVLRPGGELVLGVYAPRTLVPLLRRAHDAVPWKPWRRGVHALTRTLLRIRYRKSEGEDDAVLEARCRDFLEVPFVRYESAGFYENLARAAGLEPTSVQRVSAMNVLRLQRPSH